MAVNIGIGWRVVGDHLKISITSLWKSKLATYFISRKSLRESHGRGSDAGGFEDHWKSLKWMAWEYMGEDEQGHSRV
jgi:hypothetical protein